MSSQEKVYTQPSEAYNTPPALIAFTLGILVVCFVAFSIVYLCKYCFSTLIHSWAFQRTASGTLVRLTPNRSPSRGLDPSLLQVFPTFLYSTVKDLRKEKYSLECAICLLEFEDDSMLRLLALCCHVFHQDCIDLWLRSHKTCPVCRRDLDAASNVLDKSGDNNIINHLVEEDLVSSTNNDIRIDVRDQLGEESDASVGDQRQQRKHEHEHEHDHEHEHHSDHSVPNEQQQGELTFSRSHSTGHSIVLIREGEGDEGKNDEKYTLRLPEHVIRGRHNSSKSCASYKDIARLGAPCSNCGFVQPISSNSSLCPTQAS